MGTLSDSEDGSLLQTQRSLPSDFDDDEMDYSLNEHSKGPLKRIISADDLIELTTKKSDSRKFKWTDYMEFYILLFALFVIPPEKKRYWAIYAPVQFLVLSICCMEHILALYFFTGNFEKVAEVSHLMKAISAYIWMIVLFNGKHFKDLLRYNYRYQDKVEDRVIGTTQTLVRKYLIFNFVIAAVMCAGAVPTFLRFNSFQAPQLFIPLVPLIVVSRVTYALVWSSSIVVFILTLHLIGNRWRQYLRKLTLGEFQSVGKALITHAKLSEHLSNTNSFYQFWLMISLISLVISLISSLYSMLKDISLNSWLFDFATDVLFMMMICVPGSYVSAMTGKVQKKTNKLRALTDPRNIENIREIDSFLLYLMTNKASFKITGVTIDLSFTTKLFLALFSICGFVVQRELAH